MTDCVSCQKISIRCANYLVRQSFIFENTYRNYHDIQKTLQNQEDYQAIPAKVSQQKLMIIERNWKSFLAANQVYKVLIGV
ncbi:MAG: hypothetical protein AB4062_00760 [Crocosphaera sp.]